MSLLTKSVLEQQQKRTVDYPMYHKWNIDNSASDRLKKQCLKQLSNDYLQIANFYMF